MGIGREAWQIDLDRLGTLGDAEADPIVAEMAKRHGIAQIAALLERLMRWDPKDPVPAMPGLPEEVQAAARAFLQRADVLEDAFDGQAVDWARVERAQALFQQFPNSGLMVLGCAGLPACYAHPSVALVLTGSGRLVVHVTRRLRETIDFLLVMMTPGSLRKGGIGRAWIRKVRFMHALMRELALANAAEFDDFTGEQPFEYLLRLDWRGRHPDRSPIDQVELAYVLLTFSWLLVRGVAELGINLTEAEKNDHLYTWAVIGHGLGIMERLRPVVAEPDARDLFEGIRAARERGTEEGRLLAAALIVFIVLAQREQIEAFLQDRPVLRTLYGRVRPFAEACFQSLARTLIRTLAGPETAQKLWVARAPLVHWLVGVLARASMTAAEMERTDWVPRLAGGRLREKGLPRILGSRINRHAARR